MKFCKSTANMANQKANINILHLISRLPLMSQEYHPCSRFIIGAHIEELRQGCMFPDICCDLLGNLYLLLNLYRRQSSNGPFMPMSV